MSEVNQSQMVTAGAKALCQHASVIFGVDPEDNWKIYGDTFLEDAHVVLNAAGVADLLESLADLLESVVREHGGHGCEGWPDVIAARAAIVKATGSAA